MTPKEIQDLYSNFIVLRTYARYDEKLKRRETWDEAVDRYAAFIKVKVPESLTATFEEAIQAIKDKQVMPSMRALWTAGKAAEKDNVCIFNCFSGDTEFVTTKGIKQLKEIGKHNVLVADGSTIEADVYCFGKQITKEIIFKRNSYTKVVKATDKHNWKLFDGTEKTTDQLVYGDKIKFVFNRPTIDTKSIDYNLGIKHGFIYGDGTLQKRKNTYSQQRDAGYLIRVCSDIEDTLKYFGEYPVTYPKSFNGNPVIMMCDSFAKTHELKELPDENETLEYLLGFFRGWFAADGYISKQNQISLTCKKKVIPWLNNVLPRLGIYTQRIEDLQTPTNFGERKQETINVFLDRATLIKDDFILPRKQMLFKPYKVLYYTFNSIDNSTAREEDVYCAVVPEYKEFVLNQGLLTGNCSYTAIDSLNVFSEIMYLLMNGVGVGFSVERQFISKLPEVASTTSPDDKVTYVVKDSKEGWASAYKKLIADWYKGIPSVWDISEVRPKGSIIKTFGGRASGSEVLVELFNFTESIIFNAKGRKLNSKELADIVCKIADIVICGGVRRSACIAFSNLSDQRMRHYKEGQFWLENPQRFLANISVAYTEKPDIVSFMDEMKALIQSRSGERGIVNVGSFPDNDMRLNPCGERVLKNKQLCNLTEVVIEPSIGIEEVIRRVRLATFLGTVQASFTKFNKKILSSAWIKNTEEDAMLGVSLTGTSSRIWNKDELTTAKIAAILKNKDIAKTIGINTANGITCVKPSGTVSQVVGCSSGIHPDFSKYYIRRVRVAKIDPISNLLIDSGVPHKPEVGTLYDTTDTFVFEFPIQGSAIRVKEEETAISQLEYWKMFKEHWCDERGNPSVTIYVKDDEWLEVFNWVYTNWDMVGGISFLPADNGVYQLAPYEEITEDTFRYLCSNFPNVDFDKLKDYETEDRTIGAKEYACSGGSCELV